MNLSLNDIDWKNILIKKHLNYSLNELDCMVIFECDAILNTQPNTLITCDTLVPYMFASKDDIDKSLAKLINKKYLECITSQLTMYSSIDKFKQKLFDDEIKEITLKNSIDGKHTLDQSLYQYIENISGPISPLNKDLISNWLKQGADEGMIKEALNKSINKSGQINFRKADGFVLQLLRSKSRTNIGVSTINEERRNDNDDLKKLIDETDWSV